MASNFLKQSFGAFTEKVSPVMPTWHLDISTCIDCKGKTTKISVSSSTSALRMCSALWEIAASTHVCDLTQAAILVALKHIEQIKSRRVGGQTCNIDLSCSFHYLFFSFVLIELKPFVLKGKVLGEKWYEKVWKKCEKMCETFWNDFAL